MEEVEARAPQGIHLERKLLNRVVRVLETLIALLLVVYIGRLIYLRWVEVRNVQLSFSWLPFLVGCAVLAIFYGSYSMSWQWTLRLIRPADELPSRLDLQRIFFVSFITRYLPAGSVVNIGGRVELFKRLGGRRSWGLESIYYEQMSLIIGVVIFGLNGLRLYKVGGLPALLVQYQDAVVVGLSVLALAAYFGADLIIVHAPDFLHLGKIKAVWLPLSMPRKALLFCVFSVVNFAQGYAVYWMVRSVYPPLGQASGLVYLIVAAYLGGRLTGQLAAPVPGGIGVREGAFAFFVSLYVPVQAAVISGSLFRLASMVMESAIAGGLLLATRVRGRRAPTQLEQEDDIGDEAEDHAGMEPRVSE